MIVFTILLNQLCMGGLTLLSWFIVFIPFIMMTYVTTILLYVFGLNPTQGKQQLQEQPDPRSAHKPVVPLPYNAQVIAGCAKTQFGCCPNGVTASNINGSNCQWPQPYVRHGGHHHFLPSPSATPSPSPSATPSPSPSATPVPSASATPVPSASATPVPSASATTVTGRAA